MNPRSLSPKRNGIFKRRDCRALGGSVHASIHMKMFLLTPQFNALPGKPSKRAAFARAYGVQSIARTYPWGISQLLWFYDFTSLLEHFFGLLQGVIPTRPAAIFCSSFYRFNVLCIQESFDTYC